MGVRVNKDQRDGVRTSRCQESLFWLIEWRTAHRSPHLVGLKVALAMILVSFEAERRVESWVPASPTSNSVRAGLDCCDEKSELCVGASGRYWCCAQAMCTPQQWLLQPKHAWRLRRDPDKRRTSKARFSLVLVVR
jgi:hypothetical protein